MVEPVQDDAVMEELLAVLAQSFTMHPDRAPGYVDQVGRENFRVLRRGGRVVAGLATFWMGHWVGGRSVPTCGIAAVGVLPEVRGTGVGRQLMLEVLKEARERGVPLSTLYASTQRIYRSVGYEQAGHRNQVRVSLRSLRPGERGLEVRALDPADVQTIAPLYEAWARRQSGLLDRNRGIWERLRGGTNVYGVILGPEDAPEGYAVWQQVSDGKGFYDLFLRDRVALTPRAGRQLWTVLADHRSMASHVTMPVSGNEPWLGHLGEWRSAEAARYEPWMLRLTDLAAALEARGWPEEVEGELHLELEDADLADNAGRWILRVAGGRAEVERGGTGAVQLDRRASAPLFTGLYSASQLAAEGWIRGRDLRVADRMFAGPAPWMADHF